MSIGEIIYRYAIKFDDGRYFHGGIDTTKETQITDTLNKEIVFFDSLEELEEDYTVNLHYEDIGDGKEYDYEADYDDVLEFYSRKGNELAPYKKLYFEKKVDGIVTDYPNLAIEVLKENGVR